MSRLDVQDLRQIKDRDEWYIARFVADDAPDFNPGQFLSSAPAGPSLRVVAVEAEISREKVPLRNAYMHIGQKCSIRVNNGPIRELTGSSSTAPTSNVHKSYCKPQSKAFAKRFCIRQFFFKSCQ